MNEQPRSAVVFQDGKPQIDLAADELIFPIEIANGQKRVYFHMRPYTFDEMKAALRAIRPRVKDAGEKFISEEGDFSPLLSLFDATFLRMSNVRFRAEDVSEPSVEIQR